MDHKAPGLLSAFNIWICAQPILDPLSRVSLKDLRLASKVVNNAVSDGSTHFQRAYISAAEADRVAFEGMSANTQIATAVTEFIWDVGTNPSADTALINCDDFRLLLTVFPRFPRLTSVIFINLVSDCACKLGRTPLGYIHLSTTLSRTTGHG
ncbi:hypothetical protein BJY01DRAFT_230286 [Aspergillus pseudoustus]|uniref:Uncharacterized protein n=1 Tax=Aspergillus pseudoustus TaxID=1810923 RepID=A0ABR4IBJ5_9EURO